MTVFRVILLLSLVICFLGGVAGKKEEKADFLAFFCGSGAMFLLSVFVEKIM